MNHFKVMLTIACFQVLCLQANAEFRKQPYLIFTGSNTEMKIAYQLYELDSCTVQWGTDSSLSTGSMTTTEYGDDHQHAAILTELTPGTRYYYRVDTYMGSFTTAPPSDTPQIKFFAYGDSRTDNEMHDSICAAMKEIYEEDEDFRSIRVHSGDFVTYGAADTNWDGELFNANYMNIAELLSETALVPTMGNHGYYLPSTESYKYEPDIESTTWKKYMCSPFVNDRYWSFDYGPAHFVVLDQYPIYLTWEMWSTDGGEISEEQLLWLESDLTASTKPWKFLVLHEPGFSAGTGYHANNLNVMDKIQPLCEMYDVTAIIAGHLHLYALSRFNEVHHVTTGGGGANPSLDGDPDADNLLHLAMEYNFCTVSIDDSLLTMNVIRPDGSKIMTHRIHLGMRGVERNFELSHDSLYVIPGETELTVSTQIVDPTQLTLYAEIKADGQGTVATIPLLDNGAADDSVLANTFSIPDGIEDHFILNLYGLTDKQDTVRYDELAEFTSIGPVTVHSVEQFFPYSNAIPPNTIIYFNLMMENQGTSTTAENLSVRIQPADTNSTLVNAKSAVVDLLPGESGLTTEFLRLRTAPDLPDGTPVHFDVEILSDGIPYWDTVEQVLLGVVGIDDRAQEIPEDYHLWHNYPNPFNPSTTISYDLPTRSDVTLKVHDIQGREIITLAKETRNAGRHNAEWNGLDASGNPVSTGVYFARLQAGDFNKTIKMVYLK